MELGQFPPTGFRQHFRILCIQLADNVFSEFYDSFPLVTAIRGANGSRIATVSFADNKPALLQRSHELGYVDSLQPCVRGEFSLTRPLPALTRPWRDASTEYWAWVNPRCAIARSTPARQRKPRCHTSDPVVHISRSCIQIEYMATI